LQNGPINRDQEHCSTEVVIGRFKGELTMLSGGGDRDCVPAAASALAGDDLYDGIPL
jgi:hypothetical protein